MCGAEPRHALASSILRALHESGEIVLLDHTWDFITEGRTDCTAFWDFHHHNNAGRQRLAERLSPEITAALGE
jgi:lysophospholipase L1-like esterase